MVHYFFQVFPNTYALIPPKLRQNIGERAKSHSPAVFLCVLDSDINEGSIFRILDGCEDQGRVCGCVLGLVLLDGCWFDVYKLLLSLRVSMSAAVCLELRQTMDKRRNLHWKSPESLQVGRHHKRREMRTMSAHIRIAYVPCRRCSLLIPPMKSWKPAEQAQAQATRNVESVARQTARLTRRQWCTA